MSKLVGVPDESTDEHGKPVEGHDESTDGPDKLVQCSLESTSVLDESIEGHDYRPDESIWSPD